jgi:hypothetical protein
MMADEFDRRIMPEFLQTTFTLSLGAAYKSFEMVRSPSESISKMVTEVKTMFTIPEDTPSGIQEKLQVIAGNMMEKGATLVTDLKAAGDKFTEGK